MLPFASMAWAEDRDFSRLVKEVESRFHVKRTQVPLFGVAKPVVKVARDSGTKVVDIAIFEQQTFNATDNTEFAEVARKALGKEWQPLVRVVSRGDGEQTFIYARENGDHCSLIIATLEASEAVLIQVTMNPQDLVRLIDNPDELGKAAKRISQEDDRE
jgi:hypothetical protein